MPNLIAVLIVACEIGFWVIIAAGLALRYLVRKPRTGAIVLASIPVLDLILLVAVAFDIHRGAEVSTVHQIAGVYLGVSVAFGPILVRWADRQVTYLLGRVPRPPKAAKRGKAAFQKECRDFARWLVAAAISAVTILLLAWTVADPDQRSDLYSVFPMLGIITVGWLVTGPLWVIGSASKSKTA